MLFDLFKTHSPQIPDTIEVKIFGFKQKNYTAQATSIETSNDNGDLSFLPGHANFISIIKDKVVINTGRSKAESFAFDRAVLRCFDSRVEIYMGIELQ